MTGGAVGGELDRILGAGTPRPEVGARREGFPLLIGGAHVATAVGKGIGLRAAVGRELAGKGAQIAVIGQFTPRPYTTKDGAEKISMDLRVAEVEMFGSKSDSGQSHSAPARSAPAAKAPAFDEDEDIPF